MEWCAGSPLEEAAAEPGVVSFWKRGGAALVSADVH